MRTEATDRHIKSGGSMTTKHTRPAPVTRRPAVLMPVLLMIALSLVLSSCSWPPFFQQPDKQVGADGADFTVDGAKVSIPAGAAPEGTSIEAGTADVTEFAALPPGVGALSRPLSIVLGKGLQPSKAITVTVPVDRKLLEEQGDVPTGQTIAFLIQSEDGTQQDLVAARWNEADGTVTAEMPHLSIGTAVQIKLKALWQTALEGLGLKFPKPGCPAETTIDGIKYSVDAPRQAWLCLGGEGGNLQVQTFANGAVPYFITADPAATATASPDATVADAITASVLRNSVLWNKSGVAVMAPGIDSHLTFSGAPPAVTLHFKQNPDLMFFSFLSKLLDVGLGRWLDAKALKAIENLDCMDEVTETAGYAEQGRTESTYAGYYKSFFACANTALELSVPAQIVLAVLQLGPQLLVGSMIASMNQLTSQREFTVKINTDDGDSSLTQFVTLRPWQLPATLRDAARIDAGSLPSGATKACTSSNVSSREDSFRCYAANAVYDPCFINPQSPEAMACRRIGNLAAGQGVAWTVLTGMTRDTGSPSKSKPHEGTPVDVELTDGTRCRRSSGAGPAAIPGYRTWAGSCTGPTSGVWRSGSDEMDPDDLVHFNLLKPSADGYWQVAIEQTAPDGQAAGMAVRRNVKVVYR